MAKPRRNDPAAQNAVLLGTRCVVFVFQAESGPVRIVAGNAKFLVKLLD